MKTGHPVRKTAVTVTVSSPDCLALGFVRTCVNFRLHGVNDYKLGMPAYWHCSLPGWGWPEGLGVSSSDGLLTFQEKSGFRSRQCVNACHQLTGSRDGVLFCYVFKSRNFYGK